MNSCRYCYGVHARTAAELGTDEALIAALVSDIDSANVAPKMRPLLRFARKLTLAPASVTPADAAEVLAAGWSEQALHDAIHVICLFNFMNRLVEGHGVQGSGALFEQRGQQLAAGGYLPLLEMLGAAGRSESAGSQRTQRKKH